MIRVAARPIVFVAVLLSSACIDASRVNSECRWTEASTASLDLDRAADREHLRQDAQVAWEVGQRFADVRYRHEPNSARPLLDSCRAAMRDSIIARHHVTRAEVGRAMRARLWWVDIVAVFLPMVMVTVLVTWLLAREVERFMTRDVTWLSFGAVIALMMTGLTQIWAMAVESWRLRNEHIAGRGSVVPTVAHPAIALTAACVVVGATTAYRLSRRRRAGGTIS